MNFKFEISKLALEDLNNIWEYTAEQWSKPQANKYYNYIMQAILDNCSNPEIGSSLNEVKSGCKKKNVKSHMVVYKVVKNKIFVDRILHQSMDIEKNLKE